MVTIEVSDEIWRHLTLRKNPGDSFDDVLKRELGLSDELEGSQTESDRPIEDVVTFVRENGPVNRSDIVGACYDPGSEIKADTWWANRARAALKDVGAEFVRNKGWSIEE